MNLHTNFPQVWNAITNTFTAQTDQMYTRIHRLIAKYCKDTDIIRVGTNASSDSLHYFTTIDLPIGNSGNVEFEVYSQLLESDVNKDSILNYLLTTIDHACNLHRNIVVANDWTGLSVQNMTNLYSFRVKKVSFMRLLLDSDFYVTLK